VEKNKLVWPSSTGALDKQEGDREGVRNWKAQVRFSGTDPEELKQLYRLHDRSEEEGTQTLTSKEVRERKSVLKSETSAEHILKKKTACLL